MMINEAPELFGGEDNSPVSSLTPSETRQKNKTKKKQPKKLINKIRHTKGPREGLAPWGS